MQRGSNKRFNDGKLKKKKPGNYASSFCIMGTCVMGMILIRFVFVSCDGKPQLQHPMMTFLQLSSLVLLGISDDFLLQILLLSQNSKNRDIQSWCD